jgi:hypothetical protein
MLFTEYDCVVFVSVFRCTASCEEQLFRWMVSIWDDMFGISHGVETREFTDTGRQGGDQREARKVSMRVVLGISFARLITKGAPQGPISAECT